jgi:hypothetical protein
MKKKPLHTDAQHFNAPTLKIKLLALWLREREDSGREKQE